MSENITLQLLESFNSVNVPNVVVQLESVTSIGPLVVPFATEAISEFASINVTLLAGLPFIETVLDAVKFVPLIVTCVPLVPCKGVAFVME